MSRPMNSLENLKGEDLSVNPHYYDFEIIEEELRLSEINKKKVSVLNLLKQDRRRILVPLYDFVENYNRENSDNLTEEQFYSIKEELI